MPHVPANMAGRLPESEANSVVIGPELRIVVKPHNGGEVILGVRNLHNKNSPPRPNRFDVRQYGPI